jgi:hypothetical protein
MVDGHVPVRARRTQSMPSKYMIPSEDMGEYESPMRRRSAPGMVFSLQKKSRNYPKTEEKVYA